MGALEMKLTRSHPWRILGWSRGRKWDHSAWRPLGSSLSRPHPRVIVSWSKERKWVPCEPLKLPFLDLTKFALSSSQEADNEIKKPFDHLKNRFLEFNQVAYWDGQVAENEFAVPVDPWNIAFPNSNNSHFMMVKGQKISSKCHGSIWNTAFSTLQSRLLCWSGSRK